MIIPSITYISYIYIIMFSRLWAVQNVGFPTTTTITTIETFCGTPMYVAPEIGVFRWHRLFVCLFDGGRINKIPERMKKPTLWILRHAFVNYYSIGEFVKIRRKFRFQDRGASPREIFQLLYRANFEKNFDFVKNRDFCWIKLKRIFYPKKFELDMYIEIDR